MVGQESVGKELARGTGRLLGHVLAVVGGLILMVVGVAMGVTVVALPVGIAVGFAGLAVFLWGLFGWSQANKASGPPAGAP
jgi:hypothetical protein